MGSYLLFGYELPSFNKKFVFYAFWGGVSQIIATALLVGLFSYRNFFVGTAYSKTETIQTAILGFFILSDNLSIGAVLGISLGIIGVMVISSTKNKVSFIGLFSSLLSKSAAMGILSGLFFGIAAVCFRGASLTLEGGVVVQASFTLLVVVVIQSVLLFGYLVKQEAGQMTVIIKQWKVSALVGFMGMLGSVCWFTAMTLENAGHVRALGQIELVFSFLASMFIFKEKTSKAEFVGISIISLGIIILLLCR